MTIRQVGLYCGTFNPIHLGHLLIAENARCQFALDQVLFVTSPQPPHRSDLLLDSRQRHDMVSKVVADNAYFQASDLELRREGPSYTADTVRALVQESERRQEAIKLYLILGGDNLPQLTTWHDSDYLIEKCHFLVAPRTVYVSHKESQSNELPVVEPVQRIGPTETFALPGATVSIIDFPHVAISSSAVRERLKQGQSVLYMVPKAVAEIIAEKGFYSDLSVV